MTSAYLHCDHKKFWEIKLNRRTCETIIRIGKLIHDDLEEPSTVQSFEKVHPTLLEALEYMNFHIQHKESKGYERLVRNAQNKNNFLAENLYQINEDNHQHNQLKRKSIEPLYPEYTKQILKRDEEEIKKTIETQPSPLPSPVLANNPLAMQLEDQTRQEMDYFDKQDEEKFKKGTKIFNFDPSNFKGTYLVSFRGRKLYFAKVQDSRSHTNQYCIYKSRDMALAKAKDEIQERLKQGYLINNDLFTFDFKESETGLKIGLINKLPKSTPTSPSRLENTSKEKVQIGNSFGTKKVVSNNNLMLEEAKIRREEDELSESSLDIDFTDFNKTKGFQRSETRVRSVSPERKSHSVFNRQSTQDDSSGLGKAVNGIYASLQLPQKWERKIDPSGWYLSEKIDGVRCFWDGTTFWSKKGKKYNVPDYFYQDFPQSALDGELFMGAKNNRKLALILQKKKPKDEEWNEIKFIVSDAPELTLPFRKRLERLKTELSNPSSPYISLCNYKVCENLTHLMKELDKVEKEGGEGLLIRDPRGFYEKGKSHSVLEIDAFHYEQATILGYEQGKVENLIGGLQVRNVYGIVFTINTGMTDILRKNPPKPGTKITYRFKTVNDMGIPKYPAIIKVEEDKS